MPNMERRGINPGEEKVGEVQMIPISKIDPFPNHPYKTVDDDEMLSLAESIRDNGLITPVIVNRKGKTKYELISGHRRLRAYQLLGLNSIPASVVELGRNEATILMVESNIQRENVLPSEKAFAYKMRLDAMKQQGKRTDLTSSPLATKLRTAEIVGEGMGDGKDTVRRYIRLTNLIPALLKLVDEGRMGLRPAVELSYVNKDMQKCIFNKIEMEQAIPSHAQTIRMRRFDEQGNLTEDIVSQIMLEQKPNQKERFSINMARFEKLFPKNLPVSEREDYIAAAMEHYARFLQRKARGQER